MIINVWIEAQSNGHQTDDQDGPANVKVQPTVPAYSAMQYNPSVGQWKISECYRHGYDCSLLIFPTASSPVPNRRIFVGIPAFLIKRLTDLGHTVRAFQFGSGATGLGSHWTSAYGATVKHFMQQARLSPQYPGDGELNVIVSIRGESDANVTWAGSFGDNLDDYLDEIHTTLGDVGSDYVEVIYQLNAAYGGGSAHVDTVAAAQLARIAARPAGKGVLVVTTGTALHDGQHYAQAQAQSLGIAGADAIDALT